MDELKRFVSNPSLAGFVMLAIIGVLYVASEIITFARENLAPAVYRWRLEKRRMILPFAEKVLDKDWEEPTFFRDGGPKFRDFRENYVYIRTEVKNVQERLEKGRFLHIEGLPSSGKSVIALTIAFQALQRKKTVIYFNRPTSIPDGFLEFLAAPFASRLDKSDVLFILDDVHLNINAASQLFSFIYNKFSHTKLMFISRPIVVEHTTEEAGQFLFTQFMPKIEIKADITVRELIQFYSQRKFGRSMSPQVRNVFMHECANDLLLLGRYLKEWDGSPAIHIEEIRNAVFSAIRNDLERVRSKVPSAVRILLILGIFYRFEISVEKGYLKLLDFEIDSLIKSGEVKQGNDFVLFHHSSLAKLYSNAIQALNLSDYHEISARFDPFPLALFESYAAFRPRNLCEMIVNLRKAPEIQRDLLNNVSLDEAIKYGLEQEQNITLLGWAVRSMNISNRKACWRILQKTDLSINALRNAQRADAEQISLFIRNLHQVSLVKGREWLSGIPPKEMVDLIGPLKLKYFVNTLYRIHHFSPQYFESILALSGMTMVFDKFFEEESIDAVKITIGQLCKLLDGRIDIRCTSYKDFAGEWSTKLSLYFENVRITRFLPGKGLGIPFSRSSRQRLKYWEWLWNHRVKGCAVVVDEGAASAISWKFSLFPVGIVEVRGDFRAGDIVEILKESNDLLAVGISNYGSRQLDRIKGLTSEDIERSQQNIAPNRAFDNDLVVLIDRMNHLRIAVEKE